VDSGASAWRQPCLVRYQGCVRKAKRILWLPLECEAPEAII